ncbi:hypothetical protein AB0K40_46930 [Nonomuraea bangladeshensis]|uniref:Uncharacterized protein n=1 Tax=Nonomuraea bangladeshensis TaxID=404385 RepID=A0ABV3HKL6_9ACTN
MEAAVGEPVEGHDLQPERGQPLAQPGELPGASEEVRGGAPGQPQPEPEPLDAEQPPDPRGDAGQLTVDAGDILGGVDVGAVGQVHRRAVRMA